MLELCDGKRVAKATVMGGEGECGCGSGKSVQNFHVDAAVEQHIGADHFKAGGQSCIIVTEQEGGNANKKDDPYVLGDGHVDEEVKDWSEAGGTHEDVGKTCHKTEGHGGADTGGETGNNSIFDLLEVNALAGSSAGRAVAVAGELVLAGEEARVAAVAAFNVKYKTVSCHY